MPRKTLNAEKATERLRKRAEQARKRRAKRTEEKRILEVTKVGMNRKMRIAKEAEEEQLQRTTDTDSSKIWNEINGLRVWVATIKKATMSVIKNNVELAVQEFQRKNGKIPITEKDCNLAQDRQRKRERVRKKEKRKERTQSSREKERQGDRMRRYANKRKNIGGLIGIPIPLADDYSNSGLNCKNFVCIVCMEHFKSYGGLMAHIGLHSGKEISAAKEKDSLLKGKSSVEYSRKTFVPELRCEVCSDTFISMARYRQHVIDAHHENRELIKELCYPCSICPEAFSQKRVLVNHLRDFHEISNQCPICDQNIKKHEVFIQHMKESHADEYNSNSEVVEYSDGYFCKSCGFTNDKHHFVAQHFQNMHSDNKAFQCDVCGQKYGTKGVLETHKINVHQQEGHCCEICGKTVLQSSIKKHMESHNERRCQKLKAECKLCKRTFVSAATLRVHKMAVHMNKRLFQCTVCAKEFSCQSSLHSHRTLVCEKDKAKMSTCPICKKTFENYIVLRAHKANIHQYGNPEEDFCHLCNKKFRDGVCLLAHNNIYHHQGAKKHKNAGKVSKELKCCVCEKSFPCPNFLMAHWRIHREEKPYQCSICAVSFKQSSGFYLHRKCKHKNDEESPKKLVDEKINKMLKEAFKEAHAPQLAEARQNLFQGLNRNPETALSPEQNDNNLLVATAELVTKGSGLDGDIALTGGIVNTVPNEGLHFEPPETSIIDTTKTTGDTGQTSDPVDACLQDLNENGNEILVRTDMSQRSDFDGVESIAASEIPADIIEKENSLRNPDRGNDLLSKEFLQSSSSKDVLQVTNESGWLLDDYDDDSISFQGQNSPLSENDVKHWNDIDNKLFLGDPYKKQLIVKLEKLVEYSCSLCVKVFYDSKLYKHHLNSRLHRSTARINGQEKAIKIKSEFEEDEEQTDDDAIVSQSKKTYKNKKRTGKSNKLKKNLCCDICGKYYPSVSSLCNHRRRHIYKIECEQCGKSFNSKWNLEHHKKALHVEGEFSCTVCGIVFNQKHQLNSHRKEHSKHEKAKASNNTDAFMCDICGKVFDTRKNMAKHRRRHEGKSFTCEQCPKTYAASTSLKIHVDAVHLNKKHLCQECGKLYSSKDSLKEHMLIHKGTPRAKSRRLIRQNRIWECEVCSESLPNRLDYLRHMKVHSGVKIKCKECGKQYSNRISMYKHRRSHRNSQYNFCSICSTHYNKQEVYDRHVKSVHDPSRPFPCDQCYSFFKHKSNLILHNKNAHLKLGIVYKKKKKQKPAETETSLQT